MKFAAAFLLLTFSVVMAQTETVVPIEKRESLATVSGEVARPGPVKLVGEMSLYATILSAGGPTLNGSLRRVTVTRKGTSKVYDLTKGSEKILPAEPGDTIDVAKKNFFGR